MDPRIFAQIQRESLSMEASLSITIILGTRDQTVWMLPRDLKSELESVMMESIKRLIKIVKTSGCAVADAHSLPSPAVVEYEGQIESLQNVKLWLYKSMSLR